MYKIICDGKDCTNEEIISTQHIRPAGWMELNVNVYSSTGVILRKSYCPTCSEKMTIFNIHVDKEKRKDSLEEIVRDIVQEEVKEALEEGS